MSVGEIAGMLNDRAATLGPDLLPNGRRNKKYWETSSVDDHPTGKYSLKLDIDGSHRGRWTDFGAPDHSPERGGDMLSLVAMVKFGGRHKEGMHKAILWAKDYLGIENVPPERLQEIQRKQRDDAAKREKKARAEEKRRRASAKALFDGAVPIKGTAAETYLKGRGIDLRTIGHCPGSLKFHPAVWCAVREGKHPAMLACILGIDGQLRGVHRTYLDVSAGKNGPVRNIKIVEEGDVARIAEEGEKGKSHKSSLGPYAGGHIPLWKGKSRATLREVPIGTDIFVSEGIEDGLSVAVVVPDRRVVAAVSLSNMGGLELPDQMGDLVVIGQNDAAGSKAEKALERAIERQQEAGRSVRTMFPPAGFKDFNDVLMGVEP